MKNLSPIYDLIRADGSIVINKNLIFSLGMNEAIIYTELIAKYNYFNVRERLTEDGYFFNTVDNLLLDTGFDKRSQKKAIDKLVEYGLIKYRVQGQPPKRYFKVVDNSELLIRFIENGRNERDILQRKLLETAEKSKLKLNALLQKDDSHLLNSAICPANNTKVNNTNLNNTKERYIAITSNGNVFLNLYNKYFYRQFKKEHMEVKYTDYLTIEAWLIELTSYGIDKEYWSEQVNEHFSFLPKKNNGNILSFMEASKRYFEIENPKQMGGY